MKKILTVCAASIMVMLLSLNCFADGVVLLDSQDLYTYVTTNSVGSREEFLRATGYEYLLPEESTVVEVEFSITLDQDNDLIILDTVYEDTSLTTKSTKTGTATHDVYSNNGVLIYTVKAKGTFQYGNGTCSVQSKSGSFTHPAGSPWRSTPSVTSGNYSNYEAYVKVSGTASAPGFSNKSYDLRLKCNAAGTLSSTFTG